MTSLGGFRERGTCRLCDHTALTRVLELAPTPPANEFVRPEDPTQETFPLYLARCRSCGHVQLPVVVDPARLFRDYVYVSGTSPAFVRHFHEYADIVGTDQCLERGDLVVEVGSNDGTLLRQFRDQFGARVLGVDPARKIADEASRCGVPTLPAFFDQAIAREVLDTRGRAEIVVANNVFAHADDLAEIVRGAMLLLQPEGQFVFEVQYLGDLLRGTLFDMVYHEHLSYHSLGPLAQFFGRLGMTLMDVQPVPTHGGSIRCWAQKGERTPFARLKKAIADEAWITAQDPWADFRRRVDEASDKTNQFFHAAAAEDLRVAGYGAPAKLTTLCHQFKIGADDIVYVVDDSPWKQGLLTPGTRIPVVPASRLDEDPVDAVVVFAWNFAEQILPKLKGKAKAAIVPLPEYREVAL